MNDQVETIGTEDGGNADLGYADWLDEPSQEPEDIPVEEFDIVSAPNDWNVLTIVSFIESGAVKIPPFQRNYVWDIKRASKLIESLLLGLPVPQIFLYEEARNSFLVIDGQQRLLSIFFFMKGRFPKKTSRTAVRSLLNENGRIDEDTLQRDDLFEDFKLQLVKSPTGRPNQFSGKKYANLEDHKTTLDLRTIRNVVVKQTQPTGNNSIFEIFSRLNTGGVNLSQQEIRASLYHSDLISSIIKLNELPSWRRILGTSDPDVRMRDSEIILRALALARNLDLYAGSMTAFVNRFCLDAKKFSPAQAESAHAEFRSFLDLTEQMPEGVFRRGEGKGKFSSVLFESFFAAWVRVNPDISVSDLASAVVEVKEGDAFAETLQEGSTKSINVRKRIELAESALSGE